ncbi:MAG: hypothetical protein NVV66_01465 [Cellulomonas sp.]|uniref:hypothetical protein n=1 Tax=Cellulomonas sp. TaxID=40001 RepID=UPI00258356F9|nr:hypothetical protein [Cellulomonas sp.]MCR6703405.1 hypothetical protein [Cellulomonas sp.]
MAAVALAMVPLLGGVPLAQAHAAAGPNWDLWEAEYASRNMASRLPSSTLGKAAAGMSASVRARFAARHITRQVASTVPGIVMPSSTVGKAAKFGVRAGGAAAAAAFGVDLGYVGGTWVMDKAFGVKSQGLLCDIGALANAGCLFGEDPAYTLDSDLPPDAQGWVGVPETSVPFRNGYGDLGVRIVGTENTAHYGQPGTVAFSWVYVLPGGITRTQACNNYPQNSISLRHGVLGGTPTANHANLAQTNLWWPNVCTAGSSPVGVGAWSATTTSTGPVLLQSGGVDVATWYPLGHPSRPASVSGLRWWRTTWKCDAGGLQTLNGPKWRETDEVWPEPLAPSCDAGSVTYTKVEQMTEGVRAGEVLYEWTAPAGLGEWAATYPECGDGSCLLELYRIDAATGAKVACFDSPQLCTKWFEDPAKTSNYLCRYGSHDVELAECNIYARIFDQVGVVADPITGAPPEYGTDPVAPGTPIANPKGGCPPEFNFTLGGIGYWVWKGTACALAEAFVPKALAMPDLSNKTPFVQVRSLVQWMDLRNVGSECLRVPVKTPNGSTVVAFDSCSTDGAVSWLREKRGLMAGVLWVSVASALGWWAWRTYAPGSQGVG